MILPELETARTVVTCATHKRSKALSLYTLRPSQPMIPEKKRPCVADVLRLCILLFVSTVSTVLCIFLLSFYCFVCVCSPSLGARDLHVKKIRGGELVR